MRRIRFLTVLLATITMSGGGVGCAHLGKLKPGARKNEPVVPPVPVARRVGSVAMINEDLKFVLIDAGSLQRLVPGRMLKTMREGIETGVVKVSPEYRRPYVAADVVSGTPQIGDDVFQ